ncbi:DUF4129 domain-containing protein [Amycolatopsis samaneae]|uniref:DUF4129 domain-containing protein n=1 Tax=Amycolatopsis samaneae TaxID=664691 RepID=A0ABW5GKT5_9PSEU
MIGPLLAEVPLDIDRDTARLRALDQLRDPGYQAARPGLLQRVAAWIGARIEEFLEKVSQVVPGGIFGLLLVLVLLIVLVVVIRLRVGRVARAARASRQVFAGTRRGAAEHRRASEAAAARGDFAEAVRERFRAVVRDLEERAVLDVRSGRTADEAAAEAGAVLPELAEALAEAARRFDDVHYGGRPGTEESYRFLSDVDDRCRRARPVAVA